MKDRPILLAGLIVFLVFATAPVWHALATRKMALAAPEIKLPAREKQCVMPVGYMRASHMRLLAQWQDDVVRRQQRQYIAYDGRVYRKSLTQTCLSECHGSRREFCDRCHNYSGVAALNCWNCHSDASLAARNMR